MVAMRTPELPAPKTLAKWLKFAGMVFLAAGLLFEFADLMGWLKHRDRQAFLNWILHEEAGLAVDDPAARAFMRRFPPPDLSDVDRITRVTKLKTTVENGPVLNSAVNYMRRDQSRTPYVASLPDVRAWADESPYPWLSWILGVIGFVVVIAGELLAKRIEAGERQGRITPIRPPFVNRRT